MRGRGGGVRRANGRGESVRGAILHHLCRLIGFDVTCSSEMKVQ